MPPRPLDQLDLFASSSRPSAPPLPPSTITPTAPAVPAGEACALIVEVPASVQTEVPAPLDEPSDVVADEQREETEEEGREGEGEGEDVGSTRGTDIANLLASVLGRESSRVTRETAKLEAINRIISGEPTPYVDLTHVEGKINSTGLTLDDWLHVTRMDDSPRARRMWAADYDAIEVMFVLRGDLPGPLTDPPPPLPVYSPPFPPNTIGAIIFPPPDPAVDLASQALPQPSTRRASRQRAPSTPRSRSTEPTAANGAPPVAMRRITPRQQELLGQLVVDGERAVFGSDDHIEDWDALKDVVTTLGGKWRTGGKRGKGGFLFPNSVDVAETIRLAREHGEIFDPKMAGYFWTNDPVADRLVTKLPLVQLASDLCRPLSLLEPSAGTGHIVEAVLRADPTVLVSCVELLQPHRDALVRAGHRVMGSDFLAIRPETMDPFDAIAMNPPFAGGADAKHVLHAASFLGPNRLLAAIVSPGFLFRQTSPYVELKRWVERHGGGWEEVEAGAFADAGTNIRTVIIWGRACSGCRSGECVAR